MLNTANRLIFPQMTPLLSADILIQASRVNQALCDEAEHGRVHGYGTFYNGNWQMPDGQTILHLDSMYNVLENQIIMRSPFDAIPGSEPLITNQNKPYALNGYGEWNTPFLYLRTSVHSKVLELSQNEFCLTCPEELQVRSLGAKWNLTGCWGDKNRIAGESNWYQDDSSLTTSGDLYSTYFGVSDSNGCLQYMLEVIRFPFGRVYAPVAFLKKNNVIVPRRVYFPPENNIAIWFKQIPFECTESILLVYDPEIMLQNESKSEFTIGCIPGGIAAISKTDFSVLEGRKIYLLLQNENESDEVKFILSLMVQLRRKNFSPELLYLNGGSVSELTIPEFRKIAIHNKSMIPEELGTEYLGDLTESLENYSSKPIIKDILNEGEAICLKFTNSRPWLLLSHIAKSFGSGDNIFNEFWEIDSADTLTVIDSWDRGQIAKHHCKGRIQKAESITESIFNDVLKSAKVVLIAAETFIAQKICLEFIRFCLMEKCAVIIFSEDDLSAKLRRSLSQEIPVTMQPDGLALELSGIKAIFSPAGKLTEVEKLSSERIEQLSPISTIPSSLRKIKTDFPDDL